MATPKRVRKPKLLDLKEPDVKDPIPVGRRVTNEELADGLHKVNEFLEEHVDSTKSQFASVNADLHELKAAVGIGPENAKPVGMLNTWQFAWRNVAVVGGTVSGALVIYKVLFALFPAFALALKALLKV